MKTILINGCSYGEIFLQINLQERIKEIFQFDKIVNISKGGSSIYRQIKTTMEWLAINDKPDFILIPLTHITRYDEPVSRKFDVLSGYDQSLCVSMDPFNNKSLNNRFESKFDLVIINELLKIKTLTYNDISAYNNTIMNIIMFSSWLKSLKIKHLIFDMCNNFNQKKYELIKKIKFLKDNKNIIDIFNFCGNGFIYDNIDALELNNKKITPEMKYTTHYLEETGNIKLMKYLQSYIIDNNI